MWKRPDEPVSTNPPAPPFEPPRPGAPPPPVSAPPRAGTVSGARLGASLTFEGKLTGEEDLLVEGRFVGEIRVPQHQVTIGGAGRVEGEVRANSIVVEGEVRGNISATEHVVVRASGAVQGDIRAPRVALDQGCRFKGSIDMEPNGRQLEVAERRESRKEENRRDDGRNKERDKVVLAPPPTPA